MTYGSNNSNSKENKKKYQREYYALHREKIRRGSHAYYVKNRDTILAHNAQYVKDHRKEINQKQRERNNRIRKQEQEQQSSSSSSHYRAYADNKRTECVRCKGNIKRNIRGMYCTKCRKIVREQRI